MRRALHLPALTAASPLIAAALAGCGGGSSAVGATCQSTCEKATTLACPNDPPTVGQCVSACEAQIAGCSDHGIVQAYLDCVQTTPMVCGGTTGRASSEQCVQQGLAYFACLQGITADVTDDTTSGGDASDATGPPTPPPAPSVGPGELAVAVRDQGADTEYRCRQDDGTLAVSYNEHTDASSGERFVYLNLLCTADTGARVRRFSLYLTEAATLAAGDYLLSPTTPTHGDNIVVEVHDDEVGFKLQTNSVFTFDGSLHLDSFTGRGGHAAGWLTATWPYVKVVNGVTNHDPVERPGALTVAFDVVVP